ncbi:podocalyxin [Scomber scombrus]|uniref:podocalyxin n=1 Tax=Scomber scombrus TaxID=13677 RepID=UPI002DD7E4AB|nr:podocalyxin [Scomber scombrus]
MRATMNTTWLMVLSVSFLLHSVCSQNATADITHNPNSTSNSSQEDDASTTNKTVPTITVGTNPTTTAVTIQTPATVPISITVPSQPPVLPTTTATPTADATNNQPATPAPAPAPAHTPTTSPGSSSSMNPATTQAKTTLTDKTTLAPATVMTMKSDTTGDVTPGQSTPSTIVTTSLGVKTGTSESGTTETTTQNQQTTKTTDLAGKSEITAATPSTPSNPSTTLSATTSATAPGAPAATAAPGAPATPAATAAPTTTATVATQTSRTATQPAAVTISQNASTIINTTTIATPFEKFEYSLNNGEKKEGEEKILVQLCKRLFTQLNLKDGNCSLTYKKDQDKHELGSVEIRGTVKEDIAAQYYKEITKEKATDSKTLIAILASCGALLIMIVILAVCASHHRKPYNENQQHLTEELHTVENGYHDNPTLEVMEVQPEMQEKKMALNGEFNDSWIVPIDNLLKEDIPDEEDTHL